MRISASAKSRWFIELTLFIQNFRVYQQKKLFKELYSVTLYAEKVCYY